MPGSQHINMLRLTGRQDLAFVQYFLEEDEATQSLRQVVTDVPHIGGPFEPASPRLTDVTGHVRRLQRHQQLAIQDRVEQPSVPSVPHSAEQFDIYTPAGVSDDELDAEVSPELSAADDTDRMESTYSLCPPEVCVDPSAELVFLLNEQELLDESPALAFPARLPVTCNILTRR